jgi:DNA-binding SARP family transcriptional activator
MDNGRLRVETLGPLRAYAGDRELALGAPKQRVVFAALALSGNGVVPRDSLVDYLWGESPPATAAGSLHTYVSGLRRALAASGQPLTSSGSGYALRLDDDRLDIRVVERRAAQARDHRAGRDPAAAVGALDQALACWRPGPPLAGLPGPFAAHYRVRVDELRLRLIMERAELLLELGRPRDVVDQLRGPVAAHPFHEQLHALLMTALHQGGRTADALQQYQKLRKLLADELGIDPSAELTAQYTSFLADPVVPRQAAPQQVAAPVRPAELPRGVGDFVGRDEAVRQVLEVAGGGDGSPRIMMIVGVGGVGKTALAVHCAHRLAATYPDGQLYVNLRGFDPKHPALTPVDALHHLLTSLNVRTVPAEQEQRVALWRSTVRDRRLLIVLDNAASADQVEDLLPGGGPSAVVVTSRNRLSGLAVRYSASRVTLSPFTADESVELLSRSIGRTRVAAELPAARRLAELCDRLPLALRIASEQVTARPRSRIGDLIGDLEDVQRRLDALQIPDDELYSLRAVLSWSYARLTAEAAHAFRMLGLYPGVSIRPDVAAALLDVDVPAATALLDHLAAQHLVETSGVSYWMHDLTRAYAEEVSRADEPAAARRPPLERVLEWYVRTLATGSAAGKVRVPFRLDADFRHETLRFDDQARFVAWCTQEWPNIGPLVRAAQRIGCHDRAWQLAYLLYDYFYAAGRARSWVEVLRTGIRSASVTDDRRAHASLLNHLSVAYSRLGDNDVAVLQLQHGLRLLEDAGDDVLRTSMLGNLASTLREAKEYPEALRYARQALELAHRSGSAYYQAGCLDVLCELHAELGEYEESSRYGRPGLEMARSCQNVLLEANILINLGVSEHGLGNAEAAQRYFQEAVSLCAAGGDRYHEALALFGLAKVHRAGADRRPARELATRALLRFQDLDAEEVADVTEFLRGLDVDPPPDATRRAG